MKELIKNLSQSQARIIKFLERTQGSKKKQPSVGIRFCKIADSLLDDVNLVIETLNLADDLALNHVIGNIKRSRANVHASLKDMQTIEMSSTEDHLRKIAECLRVEINIILQKFESFRKEIVNV